MRKFYVSYRVYRCVGEYDYRYAIILLDKNEKANPNTFETELSHIGENHIELLAWSLIEE